MIHVPPWNPLVTERDALFSKDEREGLCFGCLRPIGFEHDQMPHNECWVLRGRRVGRHCWIAWLHVKGLQPETDHAVAAECLAERDVLIAELQASLDYDRAELVARVKRRRQDLAEIWQ